MSIVAGSFHCAKYYSFQGDHTEHELLHDLNSLIEIYKELKDAVGSDILDMTEEDYQQAVQNDKSEESSQEAIKYDEKKDKSTKDTTGYKRDIKIAASALKSANHECFFDKNHITFISRSGKQFMEAHHIIPMQEQEKFEYKLDTKGNIISVCPLCHRKLHLSTFVEKEPMLEKLFENRITELDTNCKLKITLSQLKNFYR